MYKTFIWKQWGKTTHSYYTKSRLIQPHHFYIFHFEIIIDSQRVTNIVKRFPSTQFLWMITSYVTIEKYEKQNIHFDTICLYHFITSAF